MCPQETHPQLFQLFYCFCAENRSAELESKMATRFYTFSKSVVVCLCQNPLHATLHATLRNTLHTYTLHYTLHYPICFSLHYTLYAMLHATLCNVLITLHSTILHATLHSTLLHTTLYTTSYTTVHATLDRSWTAVSISCSKSFSRHGPFLQNLNRV